MDLLTVPEGAGAFDASERVGDSGVGELAEAEDRFIRGGSCHCWYPCS